MSHRETGASQAVLGLELLHVLNAVVDKAEPRALAATVVGPEAEERHRRRVRHTELLLPEKKGGRNKAKGSSGAVPCMGYTVARKKKRNKTIVKEGPEGVRAGGSKHSSTNDTTEEGDEKKHKHLVRVALQAIAHQTRATLHQEARNTKSMFVVYNRDVKGPKTAQHKHHVRLQKHR